MSEKEFGRTKLSDFHDPEVAEYRAVSGMAVAALIFGLLSVAAIVDPFAWIVPAIGIVCGLIALWLIAQNSTVLIGRKAAIAGLVLSVLFGAAAVGNWTSQRWIMRRQASEFAEVWFELYRRHQPEKAFQLLQASVARQALDNSLWNFYQQTPEAQDKLEKHVDEKLIRTLLALGEDAKISYRGTKSQGQAGKTYDVHQVFSVTYEENDKTRTFFVGVRLIRSGTGGWRIARYEGGVTPCWLSDKIDVP